TAVNVSVTDAFEPESGAVRLPSSGSGRVGAKLDPGTTTPTGTTDEMPRAVTVASTFSEPPELRAKRRAVGWRRPTQAGGLTGFAPARRESDRPSAAPRTCQGSFPLTTPAPPESCQPAAPASNPPSPASA